MNAAGQNSARLRYCRRARWHDYKAPHFYHIIIYKKAEAEVLSVVPDQPYGLKPHQVSFKKNGLAFIDAVAEFRSRFNFIYLSHYVVMPDHVHLIVQVREHLPYHLGHYIKILMFAAQRFAACKVFENQYTDKILYHTGQLNNWIKYIYDNPRRLQLKRKYKDIFQKRCMIGIKDPISGEIRSYSCLGNIFLLNEVV